VVKISYDRDLKSRVELLEREVQELFIMMHELNESIMELNDMLNEVAEKVILKDL